MPARADPQTFWNAVDRNGGAEECWPFTGSTNPRGYGIIRRSGRNYLAHRYAWMLTYGTWPSECALHRCDNPPCCNPAHLFDGDRGDNNRDMAAKGRHVGNTGQRASEASKAKKRAIWAQRREQKIDCPAGHPYAIHGGTFTRKTGRVDRYCRECQRLRKHSDHFLP